MLDRLAQESLLRGRGEKGWRANRAHDCPGRDPADRSTQKERGERGCGEQQKMRPAEMKTGKLKTGKSEAGALRLFSFSCLQFSCLFSALSAFAANPPEAAL